MATLAPGPGDSAPLEVRLQYLRRRRRADPWRALTAAAMVLAFCWTVAIGFGLFLH